MKQIKIYLLISILINSAVICRGFLVGQYDGEFVNGMRLSVGIHFTGVSNKYLMQAIDSKQNKFSIKTSKNFIDDKKLIIDFNEFSCTISGKMQWKPPEIFYLSFDILFKKNNLYRYYYNPFNLLLSNISNSSNRNKKFDWPDDRDLQKMSNQTKIWFGYSNQMINNDDVDSDWSTNQIIGCIHWLNINKKEIKLEMKGDNFYYHCLGQVVIESVCQEGSCKNETIDDNHTVDCKDFLSEITTARHCYGDLSKSKIDVLHSYERIGDDTKSIIVKLAWITQQSINQCLMEIITRNNSLIEIYLNSSNQIILAIKHDKSINWSKHILYEISSNQIHVLRIEFTNSTSVFKVSNGYFIKTSILSELESVKLLNVGRKLKNNLCQQLTTRYVFRYDSKQFRLYNKSNVRFWIIFIIMIISVSCFILICLILIIRKIKKQKENIPRSTLNNSEEPIKMSNVT